MMTYKELFSWGKECLEKEGIVESQIDGWYLLEFVTKIDRTYYYLHMEELVPQEQISLYEECIAKRCKHIPLQQITQVAYFYGLEFFVNDKVLIPRHDTEVLVEEVLKIVKPGMKVLDMCTGSGCIILSILENVPDATGIGVDISSEALKVAQKNKLQLDSKVTFLQSDLFESVEGEYEIIVSNPPYIKTQVIDTLDEEVKVHEPMLALDGKEDGLYFYKRIIRECMPHLKEQGSLCFEIGHDQGDELIELLQDDFEEIRVIKDLAGLDRVVIARKRKTV